MISLKIKEIPQFLKESEYYKNLDHSEEKINIDSKFYKENDEINSIEDFKLLYNTIEFWGSKYTQSFYDYSLNNKKLVLEFFKGMSDENSHSVNFLMSDLKKSLPFKIEWKFCAFPQEDKYNKEEEEDKYGKVEEEDYIDPLAEKLLEAKLYQNLSDKNTLEDEEEEEEEEEDNYTDEKEYNKQKAKYVKSIKNTAIKYRRERDNNKYIKKIPSNKKDAEDKNEGENSEDEEENSEEENSEGDVSETEKNNENKEKKNNKDKEEDNSEDDVSENEKSDKDNDIYHGDTLSKEAKESEINMKKLDKELIDEEERYENYLKLKFEKRKKELKERTQEVIYYLFLYITIDGVMLNYFRFPFTIKEGKFSMYEYGKQDESYNFVIDDIIELISKNENKETILEQFVDSNIVIKKNKLQFKSSYNNRDEAQYTCNNFELYISDFNRSNILKDFQEISDFYNTLPKNCQNLNDSELEIYKKGSVILDFYPEFVICIGKNYEGLKDDEDILINCVNVEIFKNMLDKLNQLMLKFQNDFINDLKA